MVKEDLEIYKHKKEIEEILKIDFYKINTYENAEMADIETIYNEFINSYHSVLLHADKTDY